MSLVSHGHMCACAQVGMRLVAFNDCHVDSLSRLKVRPPPNLAHPRALAPRGHARLRDMPRVSVVQDLMAIFKVEEGMQADFVFEPGTPRRRLTPTPLPLSFWAGFQLSTPLPLRAAQRQLESSWPHARARLHSDSDSDSALPADRDARLRIWFADVSLPLPRLPSVPCPCRAGEPHVPRQGAAAAGARAGAAAGAHAAAGDVLPHGCKTKPRPLHTLRRHR